MLARSGTVMGGQGQGDYAKRSETTTRIGGKERGESDLETARKKKHV